MNRSLPDITESATDSEVNRSVIKTKTHRCIPQSGGAKNPESRS